MYWGAVGLTPPLERAPEAQPTSEKWALDNSMRQREFPTSQVLHGSLRQEAHPHLGCTTKVSRLKPHRDVLGLDKASASLDGLEGSALEAQTLGEDCLRPEGQDALPQRQGANVAKKFAKKFRSTCKEVLKNKGAGARN